MRQKPGSAKGVTFITIEDDTGPVNIVVWPWLFEKRSRIVLGSSMMAINGRIQREGEVVHLVAQQLFDLTGDLSGLAGRDEHFRLPSGRGMSLLIVVVVARIPVIGKSPWSMRGTCSCAIFIWIR